MWKRKEKCCAVCLAREACDDYIATAERSVIIHIIEKTVAVKKAANKNVFTWKIKCTLRVHDC
jgi:hypothetical protein